MWYCYQNCVICVVQSKSMSMLTSSIAGVYSWLGLSSHRKQQERGRREEKLIMKKTDEGRNRKKEREIGTNPHLTSLQNDTRGTGINHISSNSIICTKVSKRTDTNISKQEAVTCLHQFFTLKWHYIIHDNVYNNHKLVMYISNSQFPSNESTPVQHTIITMLCIKIVVDRFSSIFYNF